MLKLKPAPTLAREVEIPVAEGEPARITCVWRAKGPNGLQEFLARAKGVNASDAELLAEVLQSWSGPLDEDGQPLPVTARHIAALLDDYPGALAALVKDYMDGCQEAFRKN